MSQLSDTIIIIPARYASTRFPGKPLAPIAGKTMLERVWRLGCEAFRMLGHPDPASQVIVTVDDERLMTHAHNFGARVVLTPTECENGSERVFAVLKQLPPEIKFVVNLQGDSPLIPPSVLAEIIAVRRARSEEIISACVQLSAERSLEIRTKRELWGSGTYVVRGQEDRALYFSRFPVPFLRLPASSSSGSSDTIAQTIPLLKHLGLYAYTAAGLARYVQLPQSILEQSEKLEQLRALEHGMRIIVPTVDLKGRTLVSVDTPEDAKRAEEVIQREGELIT